MSASNDLNIDQRFGRRVRQVREELGIAQDGLAEMMRTTYGVQWHQTTVARIEAGTRPVKLAEAVWISHAFAVDLHTLLDMVPYVERSRDAQQRARRDEVQRIIRQAQHRLDELDDGWRGDESDAPVETPTFDEVFAERTGVTPAFRDGVPVFLRRTGQPHPQDGPTGEDQP